MTLFLLIALVAVLALVAPWPSASHSDTSRRSPVHPSLRHLKSDPEIRRDWRIS